jgi:hypothetical protein
MLAAAGAAAQAHYLGGLVSDALHVATPSTARLIMPPDSSFFVSWMQYHYSGPELSAIPRLLVGDWELDLGIEVRNGDNLTLHFEPRGGYQLDPGEKVSLMGHQGCGVALHGFLIPHGELRSSGGDSIIQNPFVPYAYWLRV